MVVHTTTSVVMQGQRCKNKQRQKSMRKKTRKKTRNKRRMNYKEIKKVDYGEDKAVYTTASVE